MLIVNGHKISDEQLFSALRVIGVFAEGEAGADSLQVGIIQPVPEGVLHAYVGGDIGYEGIYVDLVEPENIRPTKGPIYGAGLVTIDSPDPNVVEGLSDDMPGHSKGLTAYIYTDLGADEVQEIFKYRNTDLAFTGDTEEEGVRKEKQ